jgi:hypothetical protein
MVYTKWLEKNKGGRYSGDEECICCVKIEKENRLYQKGIL